MREGSGQQKEFGLSDIGKLVESIKAKASKLSITVDLDNIENKLVADEADFEEIELGETAED